MTDNSVVLPKTDNYRDWVTRAQLRGYGASRYQATEITKSLVRAGKMDRSYAYDLRQVIAAIRTYAERSRIRPQTQSCLTYLLEQLTSRLDNLTTFAKPSSNSEIGALAKSLLQTMHCKERQLSELEAVAATHRGKRRSRQVQSKEI